MFMSRLAVLALGDCSDPWPWNHCCHVPGLVISQQKLDAGTCRDPAKRKESPAAAASPQPISQFNRHCWLFTIGLWEHGLCVWSVLSVFTADKSVSAGLIPSRWFLTNDTKNPPFNCDLIPLPAKIKSQDHRLFFRNIFYRWCQRWNVQSVGPKERFFSSIETNNKQKITFF